MAITDQQIIEGCLKGDRNAQNQLYQQYRKMLFGICLRYSKNKEEAEDYLQDGLIKIYGDLYQYKPIGPFGGWMRRVMVNVCLQHIRRQKDLFANVELEKVAFLHQAEENTLSKIGEKALLELVQKLPVGYRAVFNMYVIEGFSHKEIAQQLGISPNTSKSQLSRAKNTLRKMLEKSLIS